MSNQVFDLTDDIEAQDSKVPPKLDFAWYRQVSAANKTIQSPIQSKSGDNVPSASKIGKVAPKKSVSDDKVTLSKPTSIQPEKSLVDPVKTPTPASILNANKLKSVDVVIPASKQKAEKTVVKPTSKATTTRAASKAPPPVEAVVQTPEEIATEARKLANRIACQEHNAKEKAKREADPNYETVFINGTAVSQKGTRNVYKSNVPSKKGKGKWVMPSKPLAPGVTLHKSKSSFIGRRLVNAAMRDMDF
jgi:hypothetical protein